MPLTVIQPYKPYNPPDKFIEQLACAKKGSQWVIRFCPFTIMLNKVIDRIKSARVILFLSFTSMLFVCSQDGPNNLDPRETIQHDDLWFTS
jgi:hypothetical protein